MKTSVFVGSATALITPMKKDGSVNYKELGRLIEFQIQNKTAALVICGTTGEGSTLTDQEKLEVIGYAVEKAQKRLPVIAGTGSNNTAHAVELSLKAAQRGADALLVITPYYNKTSQKGLVAHFSAVSSSVDLPIIVYNVPGRTGMTIEPETYLRLADCRNIVGVKEAATNLAAIATAMELCTGRLDFYAGNDDSIVSLMALGAKGVVSVLSNVVPHGCSEICRLCLEGDFKAAAALQLGYMPLINALFSDVSPIPVKEAVNYIGFNAGGCRLPLTGLDETKRRRLEKTVIAALRDESY